MLHQEHSTTSHNIVVRGLSGYENMGNTCYMNSVLQSLKSVDPFCSWLTEECYKKRLEQNKFSEIVASKKSVTKPLLDTLCDNTVTEQLSRLFKASFKYNSTIKPVSFKKIIGTVNPQFSGYSQNDCHELLDTVLSKIHDETKAEVRLKFHNVPDEVVKLIDVVSKCSVVINNPNSSPERKKEAVEFEKEYRKKHPNENTILKSYMYWKSYVKKNHSTVVDLFSGMLYSNVVCDNCSNSSASFESFNTLSLEINDESSLDECIGSFFSSEKLSGDNKYSCESCSKLTEATKTLYMWEPPEVLILHLKRFKFDGCSFKKIGTKITFPIDNLNLDSVYPSIHNRSGTTYNLQSVINHLGSYDFGHYVSSCKNGINGMWYEFNDEDIVHIPINNLNNEIVTKDAYILFYMKNRTT